MTFIGWEDKHKVWFIGREQQLIAKWRSFQFLSIPFAYRLTWHLSSSARSIDTILPYHEAKKLLNIRPSIGLWQQWGLVICIIGVSVLTAVIYFYTHRYG